MNFLIINGPNLNLLGSREPEVYGKEDYAALCRTIRSHAEKRGNTVTIEQSNHEGVLIDLIQSAESRYDGIVINPAAYTHYSIAILDALRAVRVPAVEVHLTDISTREEYRRVSVTAEGCVAMIAGRGFAGYLDAMELLEERK